MKAGRNAVSQPEHVPAVVLVHGLWLGPWAMWWLGRRFQRCGFRPYRFGYHTVRRDLRRNAAELAEFIDKIPGESVHLIGHSLGGLVIRRLLLDVPDLRPGRVVTLGTPHQASRAAHRLGMSRIGRWSLGASRAALIDQLPAWDGTREFGSLAGDLPVGAGRILHCLPKPHDGTVAVDETVLPHAEHLVLRVSHMSMLVSSKVARQVCHFLRHGHFQPTARIP